MGKVGTVKIPCVCKDGYHSFTANEMVEIIGAFQRGELNTIRFKNGSITGIVPECIANADLDASKGFTGPCNVELPDGTRCKNARGHREGRHGPSPSRKGNNRAYLTR